MVLIAFAMTLLSLPFLKFVGALLLVWIGVKLLAPDEDGHGDVQGSDKLLAAIKTIIVADLVMSVDNVIAIAGAAQNAGEHWFLLVVLGLLISIPIIVWGSQLVIKLMERFPFIITFGGMLLGWIAGGMLVTDPAFVNPAVMDWMPKWGSVDERAWRSSPTPCTGHRTSWAPCWCWQWASSSCPAALATAAKVAQPTADPAPAQRLPPFAACMQAAAPRGVDLRPPHGQGNALFAFCFTPFTHPQGLRHGQNHCVRGRR